MAILLGSGGHSYISMLESGERVPHIRDAVLLSWLFDAPMEALFPAVYISTREHFRSNMARLIELAALQEGNDSDRVQFLKQALKAVELADNLASTDHDKAL
jgi:hypothetical protein